MWYALRAEGMGFMFCMYGSGFRVSGFIYCDVFVCRCFLFFFFLWGGGFCSFWFRLRLLYSGFRALGFLGGFRE